MHRRLTRFAILIVTSLAAVAPAQPSSSTPPDATQPAPPAISRSLSDADKAFGEEDWPTAVEHYQAAHRGGINHPLLHFRLGFALHMLKRYDEALPHHRRAVRITNPALRIDALYNTACALALTGDKAGALDHLTKARDAGFVDITQLNADADLNSIRNEPGFKAIADSIDDDKHPLHRGLFQHLDFLLGVWRAVEAGPGPHRTHTFTRPLAGSHAIIVTSTWPAAGGQTLPHRDRTGSLIPDAATRQWVWAMADGLGTQINLRTDTLAPNKVRFTGRELTAVNDGMHLRWTLALDGEQLTEIIESSEDGQTWRTDISRAYQPVRVEAEKPVEKQ